MTYEEFLKLVQPNMLDASGRFLGPNSGVNYQAEGMTPEQFYKVMNENVTEGRDGAEVTRSRGNTDPRWQPGAVSTASGLLGNWGVPLAMISAPFAAGALGYGATGSTVGASTATASPVVGWGSVGATELAPLGSGVTTTGALGYGATGSTVGASTATGLLDTVGQWAKDNPTLMKLAGAALGAAASGDTKTSSTSTKDPWGPAQPYLLANLAQNQAMGDYYNRNPFSNEQKAAYQGLLNTVAQSQAGGQGLLSNAANFMRSNRGVLPAMSATPNVQVPAIDWSQYANIGRK